MSESENNIIHVDISGIELQFETNPKLFSPMKIDTGTLSMLNEIVFKENDKVLDLGCGYGVVGIFVAKLIGVEHIMMCDISELAVETSKKNAHRNNVDDIFILQSDGLKNIEKIGFTLILSNPPYHTDFSVAKEFIENGYKILQLNGKMVMVTKRLTWYKNKFISVFGGVKVIEKNGYYIFIAEKRTSHKKIKQKQKYGLSKKLQRKKKNRV